MANSISAQIRLEGGKTFANEFKTAASAVKATNSELSYLDGELKRNGNSSQLLAKRADAVGKAFEAEQKQIDLLNSRMEELNQMTGVDTSQAMNELTAELYKHKQAQAALGDSVEESGNDFQSFAQDIAVAQVVLSTMKDIVVEVAKKIWEVGKGAVKYNMTMEGYQKTIEAFFKTSGQTAEEAAKNTADLIANQKELSMATGIATDNLIDANKMLIASGVSGDDAQKAISALSKAIVATGGGNEELSRMASNLQQISNTGKASSADMKQFAMAGVDLYGLMADSTGKTVDELKDMDITFDMIVEALDSATAEGGKFFEASQVGATTLQGQMNTLQSTIQDGLGKAFEPVNQALSEQLLPLAQQLIEDINWEAIGQGIADGIAALTDLMNKINEVVEWIEAQKMDEKGKGFVEDFANGVHDNNGLMAVAAAHLNDVINAELQAEKAQATLEGANITQGVAEGMTQGKSGVIGAAEEVQMSAFAVWNQTQQAEQYGMDFVSGFATGMHRNNGLIASAAAQIANTIKEWLHFSRPDVGPLRDYESSAYSYRYRIHTLF